MTTTAESKFEVLTWDQSPLDDSDGRIPVTRTSSGHRFTGDIEGDATVEYLFAHPTESTAGIVGLFRVTGSVGGRSGTFVLQSSGSFDNGVVQGELVVVKGSGTGELTGLDGHGEYVSEGTRTGRINLEYDLG